MRKRDVKITNSSVAVDIPYGKELQRNNVAKKIRKRHCLSTVLSLRYSLSQQISVQTIDFTCVCRVNHAYLTSVIYHINKLHIFSQEL